MKKRLSIILVFALLCFSAQSFAQETKCAIGFEAGPGRTFSHGNPELWANTQAATRVFAGMSFQYYFNNTISLRTGLAHEQKGHIMKAQFVDPNGLSISIVTVKAKFSYLTVPVMVRATFGKKSHCFVNAGPFIGFALSHKTQIEFPDKTELEQDHSATFKATDLGISAGAGLVFPVGSNLDLSLEMRNNLGLLDINKLESDTRAFRTNTLNLLVGLSYKIGQ
jgi:hypothetical protein